MSINDPCPPSHLSFRSHMKLLLNLYVKYTHLQGWRESAGLQGSARTFKQNLLVTKLVTELGWPGLGRSKQVSHSSYPGPPGLSAELETSLCNPALTALFSLLWLWCHHLCLFPDRFGSNGEGGWGALSVSWAGPKAVGQESLLLCEQTALGRATGEDCCSLLTTTCLKNLFSIKCSSSSGARGRV